MSDAPATYPDDHRPMLRPDVVQVRVGQESVLWVEGNAAPVYLDPVDSLLFELFTGDSTVGEIRDDLIEILAVDPELVRVRMRNAILHGLRLGALVHDGERTLAPLTHHLLPEPNW